MQQATAHPRDLDWLAFLLTGDEAIKADAPETVGVDASGSGFFSGWMRSWSRKLALSRALATVRSPLRASADRMQSRHIGKAVRPQREWSLDANTSWTKLEGALLAIDLFPRCALVLSILEGLSVEDVSILLDCAPEIVRKAQAIGAHELTANLARPAQPAAPLRPFGTLNPGVSSNA